MTDELMTQFLIEAREAVASAERNLAVLLRRPDDVPAFESCFRAVHTLKGSTGLFDLVPMGLILHGAEDLLTNLRTARTGTAEDFEAIIGVIDHVDRWLDALERTGVLPRDAERIATADSSRLRELAGASSTAEGARNGPSIPFQIPPAFAGHTGLAIRYTPRSDCYFSGDDPLAILSAVPGLVDLRISPREPWGALADYDPYACNLVLEAVTSASRSAVEAAVRFVADQVEIAELAGGPAPAQPGPEGVRRTLRIDAERIDRLADIADDLVIAKNGFADLAKLAGRKGDAEALVQALRVRHAQLERLVIDLHAAVGQVRLLPLESLFSRFPRLVRDIARTLGKTVELEIEGGQIEVDKAVVDGLFDPLLHVLRNAVDHGVEDLSARRRAGKPDTAAIRLSARTQADQVVIEVRDDGAGIDPARIRALAVERCLMSGAAADALDDRAAIDLIFIPGFSSAAEVSAVSGRGVGMDVVRDAALRLGGTVGVDSQKGQGSTVRFILPITRVLTRVMIVTCGGERYGLALEHIVETVRVDVERIIPIRSGRAFRLRDEVIPLVALSALVGVGGAPSRAVERVVVVRMGGEHVGLIVDGITDHMNAAVRPMSGLLAAAPGMRGTALLPDGAVLMILDMSEFIP